MQQEYDYIVIGSGIAGLFTALLASEYGRALIVTKGRIDDANTRLAQGGIAAAVGKDDSPEKHVQDTIVAGAGLCDPDMVAILAWEGPQRILDLISLGVPFDTLHGELALAREGAHSINRILHAGGDATGAHIETTLAQAVRSSGIALREHNLVTHLLVKDGTAYGIEALPEGDSETVQYRAQFIVLCTGGAGQLFRHTTNPEVATGDGVALAFEAGAQVMDMEFYQFHPTAFAIPGAPTFLVSEAARGEGAILRDVTGRAFMKDYHEMADLAPRDIVSRAIVNEMQKAGSDHVLLDMTHLPEQRVKMRFPHISRFALEHGLDITSSPIPVAPAAHYMMGGVRVDAGSMTSIRNLYACGEVACTGVHGANRLASNSLLESVVFSKRAVEHSRGRLPSTLLSQRREEVFPLPSARSADGGDLHLSRRALQDLAWQKVGILRSGDGLRAAVRQLRAWAKSAPPPHNRESHELQNLLTMARLMSEAALIREESRGAHYRTDFPQTSPEWAKHIVLTRESV